MVDPKNEFSVACVRNILQNVYAIAKESGKTDKDTLKIMDMAVYDTENLIYRRKEFAGKPGDYEGNKAKRTALINMLKPGC